jgi:hypothetical protein
VAGDDPITDAIDRLHHAGWSCADFVVHSADGSVEWVAGGFNGENRVEGRGPTAADAWRSALQQAWSLGMLGPLRPARGDRDQDEG